jgi:hypothetical protein
MNDRPDDPDIPLAPFPTALPTSPFPPPGQEAVARPDAVADRQPADWMAQADPHDLTPAPASVPAAVNPLLALGRFAFPPGEPPDDEGFAARARRWTSRVLVVATVFLLVFNAVSIQNWSRQQEPGWVTTTVRRLSDVWAEQMALLGADQPREAVREGYERARDADWRGSETIVSSPARSDGEVARSAAE